MKERPILMSTPMVKAVFNGRKTMTRRIVKGHPAELLSQILNYQLIYNLGEALEDLSENDCPYGQVGDILWVRETFVYREKHDKYYYKADSEFDPYAHNGWKPSIFMPRKACRILLEITKIRIERINEITNEDALSEGIEPDLNRGDSAYKNYHDHTGFSFLHSPYESFQSLWGSINGSESWYQNPWVWVIEFKKTK